MCIVTKVKKDELVITLEVSIGVFEYGLTRLLDECGIFGFHDFMNRLGANRWLDFLVVGATNYHSGQWKPKCRWIDGRPLDSITVILNRYIAILANKYVVRNVTNIVLSKKLKVASSRRKGVSLKYDRNFMMLCFSQYVRKRLNGG